MVLSENRVRDYNGQQQDRALVCSAHADTSETVRRRKTHSGPQRAAVLPDVELDLL
jgi:hypothetical protein